jgi:hypothetical protein
MYDDGTHPTGFYGFSPEYSIFIGDLAPEVTESMLLVSAERVPDTADHILILIAISHSFNPIIHLSNLPKLLRIVLLVHLKVSLYDDICVDN